jgi:ATPase subunit of ABC transporter with duplicated ATPase domains
LQRPPGTLVASRVTKSHGADVVLADVSLVVRPRAWIGLVGPNGIGKATLLRVLAGLEQPDLGRVERIPRALAGGYLPQEADVEDGETLLGYLAPRSGVLEAEQAMDALAARLGCEPELAERYAAALDRFLALGGADLTPHARAVCTALGLPAERLEEPASALSGTGRVGLARRDPAFALRGGGRRRGRGENDAGEVRARRGARAQAHDVPLARRGDAALASFMALGVNVLVLDEPTNHSDLAAIEELESAFESFGGTAVVVSHDRRFLDRLAATRTFRLGPRP